FLVNRNKKWIPVISTTSREKPTFFGVGAAHLIGENGVINLLRKSGFTVEAM
ncbi:MAG: TraB/GumN family protein, partial [Pedobacter sp.]